MGPQQHKVERRLAAIFAADVAGYSRLMEQDEVGTLRALTAHREVMDRLIAEHGGRIANTAGDSVLAEFPSVVNAVECAVEVQQRLILDSTRPKLLFRIGVHVGDVMIREGDLLGDGVNIAARLQALAEPGSICVSSAAHDYVRKTLSLSFSDLGPQKVKNIDEPVRAYAINVISSSAATVGQTKPLPLPDKPSIAILPFTNLSGDPEQEYFADGVVEDIITALSRIRWFFVIARHSSFTYKGKCVDIRQVGRELGVRYVLEGSIRRMHQKVRITGQLIEAATARHVWADRFDGDLADIFDLQDAITQSVVSAIEPNVRNAEIERAKAKATDSLDAYDFYLRALPEFYSYTEQGYKNAEVLLQEAVVRDPQYSDAWGALADCVGRLILGGWVGDRNAALEKVRLAAAKAVESDPNNGWALANAAWAYATPLGNTEKGLELANQALRIHPNSAQILMQIGWVFIQSGEVDRALGLFHMARRLSPIDPRSYSISCGIAAAHYFSYRFDEAVQWAERAVEQSPTFPVGLRFLAAAQAQVGRTDEAHRVISQLLRVQPTSTLTLSRTSSYRLPEMLELYLDGLRKAGLPE